VRSKSDPLSAVGIARVNLKAHAHT